MFTEVSEKNGQIVSWRSTYLWIWNGLYMQSQSQASLIVFPGKLLGEHQALLMIGKDIFCSCKGKTIVKINLITQTIF